MEPLPLSPPHTNLCTNLCTHTNPCPHPLNRQVTEPGQSMFDLSAHRFKLMVDWIKTLPGGTETDFVLLSCSGAPRPGERGPWGRCCECSKAAREEPCLCIMAFCAGPLGSFAAGEAVALTQFAAVRSAACVAGSVARGGPASRLRWVLTVRLCIISALHTDLTPAIRDKVVTYKRKGEAALRNRCGARRGGAPRLFCKVLRAGCA